MLLTDTVGFVRRLPHGLIEAFKGTLETAVTADLLVHVVDSSAPYPDGQIAAVREVLSEISADDVPEFIVFNKSDLARDVADDLLVDYPGSVVVSAVTGEGIDHMLATLGDRLRSLDTVVELLVPWDRGDVIASIHREGQVVSTVEDERGMTIRARLSEASAGRLDEWLVSRSSEAASNSASEGAVGQDESMHGSRRRNEGLNGH